MTHFSNGASEWNSRFNKSSRFHGFSVSFCCPVWFSFWSMPETDLIHDPVHSTLTGDMDSLWLLQQQCLIHPDVSINIVTFILADDFSHGICQILILPWTVSVRKIFIEALSANTKNTAIKCDFSFELAILCLECQKDHSLVFAGLRRLAAKKR